MKQTTTFLLAIILSSMTLLSQNTGDTITIETFNYSQTYGVNQWSGGIRDSVIDFSVLPDVSFEKVIMSYNMRCKDARISNGSAGQRDIGCGEWDISCNTFLHDSSRVDSVRYYQPKFVVTGFSGQEFTYTDQPISDVMIHTQKEVEILNLNSGTLHEINENPTSNLLIPTSDDGRLLLMYTSDQLLEAGVEAGELGALTFEALQPTSLKFMKIKLAHTSATEISSGLRTSPFFKVNYFIDTEILQGENMLVFNKPFEWNGSSNLLIEITYLNGKDSPALSLPTNPTNSDYIGYANADNYVDFSAGGNIEVPTETLADIDKEITIMFWAKGNSSDMPTNTSILHALDSDGKRNLNIHLPWSNGNIYWDSGSDADGHDRIEKAATSQDYAGNWSHWAFTKNTETGSMKIYLNGEQWATGTGKSKPLNIKQLSLGANSTGGNVYKGGMDEVSIWNKELTAETIKQWYGSRVTEDHPNYENLELYYTFDGDDNSQIADLSVNAVNGNPSYFNVISSKEISALSELITTVKQQPQIIFHSNMNLEIAVTDKKVNKSVTRIPQVISEYGVVHNSETFGNDSTYLASQIKVYDASPIKFIDVETNQIVDTKEAEALSTIALENLPYYNRWPSKFEVMSFVTPYGLGLNLGSEGKTWLFDVTDFLPILTGTKRMTMENGGQWMEDMDIRFHFIVGTPPADVIDIQQMWRNQKRGYAVINNDTYFPPREFTLNDDAERFIVKSTITGHGQEGEFIPRNHHLNVNGGEPEFSWSVWKECSLNPIFPQGGTWVYDRAGWCPGAPSDVEHSDITPFITKGSPVTIDYDVDVASGASNYIVNHQLVSYGEPNHKIDAAVTEVLEPSNRVEFSRFNNICSSPVITIANLGSDDLTSAEITYWLNDSDNKVSYQWSGKLGFSEKENVILPTEMDFWNSRKTKNNVFNVEINAIAADEYSQNNTYASPFEFAKVLPPKIELIFKTNSVPFENSYSLKTSDGEIVFESSTMLANTIYEEPATLGVGCYTLEILDSDHDGMDWWANNDGKGYVLLMNGNGGLIESFEMDFGGSIIYNFAVEDPSSIEEQNDSQSRLYPNPAKDAIKLTLSDHENTYEVRVYDIEGRLVKQLNGNAGANLVLDIDVSELQSGYYSVKLLQGKNQFNTRFIKE